jgi:cysteine desulfurase
MTTKRIMKHVYLDHCATTPVDRRVVEAMMPYYSAEYGNASSIHGYGRKSRLALEESRERIARFIGANSDELFFTSGGTESDNHALYGIARASKNNRKSTIVTSAVEHHAILDPLDALQSDGFVARVVKVDGDAIVNPDDIKRALDDTVSLVSIVHANNEVGTIEPVKEIASICRERGVICHTDAVQSVGKIDVDVRELGIDLLSLSAHKLYGPKGIGAIFIKKGTNIDSFMKGGAQESNRRAGTENVPLAVGFAKAVELCSQQMKTDSSRIGLLKEILRKRISQQFDYVLFNGHDTRSLPHVLSVSFDSSKRRIDGEALIIGLDLHGVAVTSGSACTSGSLQPSHVLLAMGRDESTARATIRFSLGRGTTEEDIDYTADVLNEVVERAGKEK